MHKLRETRVLPYSHKDLFDLVMDVESYPKFLPFCVGAGLINRHCEEQGSEATQSKHFAQTTYESKASKPPLVADHLTGLLRNLVPRNEEIEAELTIKFGLFTKSYRSLVTSHCDDAEAIIEAKAISGPFKYLSNLWKFTPVNQSTLIEFYLDFELESLLLDKMLGSALDRAYSYMIEAFEKRAQQIYGKNTSS